MTCRSATSLALVRPPTAATLPMARAPKATHRRTAGSSSGEHAGSVPLGIGSRFVGKKKPQFYTSLKWGLPLRCGRWHLLLALAQLDLTPSQGLLPWGREVSQKAMPAGKEGQCGETQVGS